MTEAEFKQLEENILKAGRVKVPISVWNGTIVDGHNRWAIIQKHPGIPYEVEEEHFADRYEAIVWICKNQLGRRNLTDAQKAYLIGRQYEAQKMTAGGDRKSVDFSKDQNGPLKKFENTAQKVAADLGVGEQTVKRSAKFAKGVDAAEKIEGGAREAILSGKSKVPKHIISEIPKMEQEEQREVIAAAKAGSTWPPKKEEPTGSKIGYTSERRQLNAAIRDSISSFQNSCKPIEHTVDDLVEDLNAIVEDFAKKAKRSLMNHSTLLQSDAAKKEVTAALVEAETAIKKLKELLL